MAGQVRKRAFSKAFQHLSGHLEEDALGVFETATMLSSTATAPLNPTHSNSMNVNKENSSPPPGGNAYDAVHRPVLQEDYTDFAFDSDSIMGTTIYGAPRNHSNRMFGLADSSDNAIPLREIRHWSPSSDETDVQDRQLLEFTPRSSITDLSSSPPRGPALAHCLELDFAIHQDYAELKETIIQLPDQSGLTDMFTPSGLNFQDLSLFETSVWSESASPLNPWPASGRTSYFTLPSFHATTYATNPLHSASTQTYTCTDFSPTSCRTKSSSASTRPSKFAKSTSTRSVPHLNSSPSSSTHNS